MQSLLLALKANGELRAPVNSFGVCNLNSSLQQIIIPWKFYCASSQHLNVSGNQSSVTYSVIFTWKPSSPITVQVSVTGIFTSVPPFSVFVLTDLRQSFRFELD